MAGWADLIEARPPSVPKQVFLCTGEISSLVWDYVHEALGGYDFFIRAGSPDDLSYSTSGMGVSTAYLLVDPSPDTMGAVESLLRRGGTEAVFVLISQDIDKYPKPTFEYIKKKAQQHKSYYTMAVPKSEQARAKMISFFLMRWGVGRETSQQVCSSLEYSPGQIYLFDQQFLLCTGGQVLPSSRTNVLVEQLLGEDSPNMVVSRLAAGTPINLEFDEAFTYRVLKFLHTLIGHARLIHGAGKRGDSTLSEISKATGLTQFLVMRAWGMAEAYDPQALRRREELVLVGMENVTGNPDLLATLSRVWGA